ncbi:MAG: glycosyltransferase [Rikenellaceae bacterium]|jgi:glycosyltransferase involved in cell wall biosynthesis|nr:glycosyltransferase [Rikenellaceae bacterium]
MSYLVSVVVPTKNRYKYLKELIKLIDSFRLDELELVVQDNSDNNSEILEYLSTFDNPNIKYYYRTDSLTMSGNADVAISNATGEYICYIGDDDGVCRNIVDVVRYMKERQIAAACSDDTAWYYWNGRAKLFKSRKPFCTHESTIQLDKLLRHGLSLWYSRMPLIYHGIVLKTKLIELQNKIGTCFPGNPPDIAGAIALSSIIDKYYEIKIPVIINGISAMAGGGVDQKGGVLPLDKVPFINEDDILNWEKTIPPVWCGHYAWANSGMKALRKVGLANKLEKLNLEYALAYAVAYKPHNRQLRRLSFKYSTNVVYLLFLIVFLFARRYIQKIHNNVKLFVSQSYTQKTIIEAEQFFTNHTTVKL